MLFDATMASEAFSRLIWETEVSVDGATKLTVTHELDGAPTTAALVSAAVPDAGGG